MTRARVKARALFSKPKQMSNVQKKVYLVIGLEAPHQSFHVSDPVMKTIWVLMYRFSISECSIAVREERKLLKGRRRTHEKKIQFEIRISVLQ